MLSSHDAGNRFNYFVQKYLETLISFCLEIICFNIFHPYCPIIDEQYKRVKYEKVYLYILNMPDFECSILRVLFSDEKVFSYLKMVDRHFIVISYRVKWSFD